MTIGNMWKAYEPICNNGEWSDFETDQGVTVVQYKCDIDPAPILKEFYQRKQFDRSDEYAREAAKIDVGFNVKLIAQYPFYADGSGFEVGYASIQDSSGRNHSNLSKYIYPRVIEKQRVAAVMALEEDLEKLYAVGAYYYVKQNYPESFGEDLAVCDAWYREENGGDRKPVVFVSLGEPYEEDSQVKVDAEIEVMGIELDQLRFFFSLKNIPYENSGRIEGGFISAVPYKEVLAKLKEFGIQSLGKETMTMHLSGGGNDIGLAQLSFANEDKSFSISGFIANFPGGQRFVSYTANGYPFVNDDILKFSSDKNAFDVPELSNYIKEQRGY